jgi:hypothetical protein
MFAALTVIFTKIGGENVHSDFATLIRTLVILLVLAGIVAAPADGSGCDRQAQRRAGRPLRASVLDEQPSSLSWLGVALIADGAIPVAYHGQAWGTLRACVCRAVAIILFCFNRALRSRLLSACSSRCRSWMTSTKKFSSSTMCSPWSERSARKGELGDRSAQCRSWIIASK